MSVLSGYQKVNRYIKQSSGYKKLSQWTSSNSVQMDDGKTLQANLGNIKGITSSLATTNANYALSASAGKSLQDQITTLNNGLSTITNKINDANTGLGAKYGVNGIYVNDCLTETAMPGNYIYQKGAKNAAESNTGGCIFTFGFYAAYSVRICITTYNNLYISLYQAGISYGSWKQIT